MVKKYYCNKCKKHHLISSAIGKKHRKSSNQRSVPRVTYKSSLYEQKRCLEKLTKKKLKFSDFDGNNYALFVIKKPKEHEEATEYWIDKKGQKVGSDGWMRWSLTSKPLTKPTKSNTLSDGERYTMALEKMPKKEYWEFHGDATLKRRREIMAKYGYKNFAKGAK